MDEVNVMFPLQNECEDNIPTPAAELFLDRCGCSGSMDGVDLMLPLQNECGDIIPTPTVEVLWDR